MRSRSQKILFALVSTLALLVAPAPPSRAAEPVQVTFWYPVDLGGGLANVMQSLVD